ncbi:MAG: hypothetical protein CMG71_01560 [Candidatus Marinimicrobia bacterium]|nr:hypothetical protein [Candidatus Neomarinimicrobiota bacterium]|tara:strand:+ start:3321 stop:6803 length:3483 start_codon:yes stop_codon:yes gene_type:complete
MNRILLIGALLSSVTAQSEDRLRLIYAELLENITDEDGKAVQLLTGNVKFQKGAAIISCQRALYSNRDRIGSFTDNVRMEKEEQILIADSLRLDSNNDIVTAHGSVRFRDSEYGLKSKMLTFYTEMDSGIAEGDVEFVQKGQTITAEKIIYKKESNDTASYRAEGDVTIQEQERTATCGISIYDAVSDLSQLLDDPIVEQDGQQLSGNEIHLWYRDDDLFRLSIPEEAHIVYERNGKTVLDSLSSFKDDMTAQSLEAFLEEGLIDSVRLEGMATTLYHLFEDSVYQGKNIASGDTITLLFEPDSADNRDITSIHIAGGARGEYYPDSTAQEIDDNIVYIADTIKYSVPMRETWLRKDVEIDYQDTELKSGFVNVIWKKNLMKASAAPPGTVEGDTSDRPLFTESGREPMRGETLTYNLKTGRGRVKHGTTRMDDGYYRGEEIRNQDNKVLFVDRGIYTTCDLIDDPHFHFGSRRMKMIMNDLIIAKPIILYLSGIPLMGLPFAVFPDQSGKRHSGWIMPSYGQNAVQGRYLRGLGYFWAVNDYLNSRFTLDFYDKEGIVFQSSNNYFQRYKYSGSFNFRYNRTVADGDISEFFSNPGAVRWSGSWNHAQQLRRDQSLNINGRYYSDSAFNQELGIHRDTRLNQSAVSNATYSKRWKKWNASVSANLSETKNLMAKNKIDPQSIYYETPTSEGRRIVESTSVLPTLNFRKGQTELFAKGIYFSYGSTLKNRGQGYHESEMIDDSTFVWGDRQSEYDNSWVHSMSVSGSSRLFKYIAVRPSVSFREEWITKSFAAGSADTLGRPIDQLQVDGFRARHTGNLSVSTNTKLYGILPIRIGRLKTIRHTITPSIGLSYRPDFSDEAFGYIEQLEDEAGNLHPFDPFRGTQIGATATGEQKNLSISVRNLFQAKVDEGEKERKIDNLLTWNINTNYNFAAERYQMAKLRSTIRSGWMKKLNLDFSMSHDFYDTVVDNGKITRLETIRTNDWGLPIPRLTNINAATGFNISGKRLGWQESSAEMDTASADTTAFSDLMTGGIRRPGAGPRGVNQGDLWNLNVSLRYAANKQNPLNPRDTFWMNTRLGINISKSWRIQYNARFDLMERDLVSHDVSIYRDLHCWEMNFTWTPSGFGRGFYLRVNVKSPTLRDLKFESRGGRWSGPGIP